MSKYTRAELAGFKTSKAKKMTGVSKRGDDYYLGAKKIIPVEDHAEWLKQYYDDPNTGYCGRDRLYSKIAASYAGISRRDVVSPKM